ncbi:MAG: GNAT family N-acetyltransferase [Pseudomonadales bacterium]|nr:GNAT family N-acetyltransferase [Pseudomonadales bacterium]
MTVISITSHDDHPSAESALVDAGLEEFNSSAASLDEVRLISSFARSTSGEIFGGAVGRIWGPCCELQQLWVEPSHRRQGIGTRLVRAFEAQAALNGCSSVYLETFSFQSPALYDALGYSVEYERRCFPHGVVKFHMTRKLPAPDIA